MHVGFLNDGGQRLLGHAPRFKKAREIAAFAKLRNAQLDSTRAGLPVAVAEAVAVVEMLAGACAMRRTAQGIGLQRHQSLRGAAAHLAQQARVARSLQKRWKSDT